LGGTQGDKVEYSKKVTLIQWDNNEVKKGDASHSNWGKKRGVPSDLIYDFEAGTHTIVLRRESQRFLCYG